MAQKREPAFTRQTRKRSRYNAAQEIRYAHTRHRKRTEQRFGNHIVLLFCVGGKQLFNVAALIVVSDKYGNHYAAEYKNHIHIGVFTHIVYYI